MNLLLVMLTTAAVSGASFHGYDLSEKEVINKTLQFPDGGSSRQLVVDNINGSIHVVGYEGNDIQLVVHRTSYADSPEKLREAKEKVRLDIKGEPGRMILYVDAPWRCHDGHGIHQDTDHYGYDANFDFEIKVPAHSDISLNTVNEGDVRVEDVSGAFEVGNVNGAIDMTGIIGSGLASTVNGTVQVQFKRNPESRCSFKSINGSLEIKVPDDLSADLKFKTFNGEMYSDFEVTSMPHQVPVSEKSGRRTIYRGGDFSAVRAGRGGPELRFETLNGDIRILKSHE